MGQHYGLVIDGGVEAGEEGTYPVLNPARPNEVVLDAPAASLAQVERAVGAARRALPAWSALTHAERTAAVIAASQAAGKAIEQDDLAAFLTREHGKILLESTFDIGTIAGMAAGFAPMVEQALEGREHGRGDNRTEVERVPHGVIAALLPFNWPVAVMGNKVLPGLLAGNTAVVKAPPSCPGAVLAVVAAMAAQLPAGVLNVVNGPLPAIGEAIVTHPGVDMVSFTGGVPTGRAVMAAAAATTKPVVLELGGNDPAIFAPDVVVDDALADRIFQAAFVTSGQVCMAIKRLYVPEERRAQVVDALVERVSREVVGDGLVDEVTMGPVHRPEAQAFVEGLVAQAEQVGAKVHRPGTVRAEDASSGGYFVSPAIVDGPPPDARIVREEQFAPALPVIGYTSLENAIAAANDTEYGLCASVWSNDLDLAAGIARRLEAGTVFVNTHGMSAMDPRAPMGGWKQSGFGVELGPEGMRAFTRPRVIITNPGPNA